MRRLLCLILFLYPLCAGQLPAQSVEALEARLRAATSPEERGELCFKLARNWLADRPDTADVYAGQALALARETGDKKSEAEIAFFRGDIALRLKREVAAITHFSQAREVANAAGLPELSLQAVEQLEELTARRGDFRSAYTWSRERAELLQAKARRAAEEQRQKQATMQAELSAEKKRATRIWMAALAGLIFFISVLSYFRQRANRRTRGELAEKNAMIEEKRRRSEQLLLNILPKAVAAELTITNKVTARRYEQATIMFVDFVNFTQAAERLEPEMLVKELDFCFSRFDTIIGRYRIEKIKTVGDAYICASGLSDQNENPADMISAGLEIQAFLQNLKAERAATGRAYFEARIGIHCGPVVAGVVGLKKFAYDIWGDTVNTAARMEEACEPGRVNVSGAAQAIARQEFQWEYRGKIATKNKDGLEMYYAVGAKNV